MAGATLGAAPLLHFGLEHMPAALLKLVAHLAFVVAEHRPVVVVEVLDDLESPAAVEHVAADEFGLQAFGDGVATGVSQLVARLTEQQVGASHQLVKRVQVSARPFHPLQGLRDSADRLDSRVVESLGAAVLFVLLPIGHDPQVPASRSRHIQITNRGIGFALMSFPAGVNVNSDEVDSLVSRPMEDPDEPRYTVRVVAQRVGVPTATLRSWSQRYGVGPPRHRPGRHRLYSENDIAAVRHMHELIGQGTSTRSAANMAVDSTMPPRGDVDALLSAALDLDLASLGRLLETHLRHFGVLDTWELIVRPAFAAIVAKQDEGGGCVDVEHALSWTVSRALQGTPLAPLGTSKSVILACTPRETHVLPLEALRAALAERGHGALILGADVPVSALTAAFARVRPPVRVMLWSQTGDTADMELVRAAAVPKSFSAGPDRNAISRVDPGVRVHSLRAAVECCAADVTGASISRRLVL